MQIFRQAEGTLDEKLTAVYVRALERDCFDHYKPLFSPPVPDGWFDAQSAYRDLTPEKKSAGWKAILERFGGYIKALNQRKFENNSNEKFLADMLEHFEKVNLPVYAEKVRFRLGQFQAAGMAA